jgi:hypothetical protein
MKLGKLVELNDAMNCGKFLFGRTDIFVLPSVRICDHFRSKAKLSITLHFTTVHAVILLKGLVQNLTTQVI